MRTIAACTAIDGLATDGLVGSARIARKAAMHATRLYRQLVIALLVVCTLVWQAAVLPALAAAGGALPPEERGARMDAAASGDTITVYGPQRYTRKKGKPSTSRDRFALGDNAVAPYTLHVENGAPRGTRRVTSATIRLNAAIVVKGRDITKKVPTLDRAVPLLATNALRVRIEGAVGSFLKISFTATRAAPAAPAPVISDFAPTAGPVGTLVTLTGSALTANTGTTVVTFAGEGGARLAAPIAFASATEVRASVPEGAVTGPLELTTAGGRATTREPFTLAPSQDYALTVTPPATTAVQGTTAMYVLYITSPQPTFTQLASLSAADLPPAVQATFDPARLTAGGRSTLSLRLANADLAPGSYPFSVQASAMVDGRDLVRTVKMTLNVIAAGETTLAGRVLSSDSEPILGATASLDGRTATTDAAGAFLLSGVAAGVDRPLMVDGRTASAPNRTYPVIAEPATIVAGQANVVPYTFYLPPIQTQYEVERIPDQPTVATNPTVPGLEMTIPAGANLRNRDGSPVARVSITPLPPDRTPAPLPPNTQTTMVYSSQPGGAVSDIALPVVYPNLTRADPGTRLELYSFNHDTVTWNVYGFGRVSADGRTIAPEIDPATRRPYGLPDFSWHYPDVAGGRDPNAGDSCPNPNTDERVDLSTGIKIEETTDIVFGGARGGLTLTRLYTSDVPRRFFRFGIATRDNYEVRLSGTFQVGGAGRVIWPDQNVGRLFSYASTDADGALVFTSTDTLSQLGDRLRRLANGTFEYRSAQGAVMRFDTTGRLIAMADRKLNTTTLTYDTGGRLTQITDPVGRAITLEYNAQNFVTRATDPIGRSWQYGYTNNFLTSVTDPLGYVTQYTYNDVAQLLTIRDGRGVITKQLTYDNAGRVIQQMFADGGFERYDYLLSGRTITGVTITDSLGRTESKRFNAAGYVIATIDALGQSAQIDRDIRTNLPLSIIGPCGCVEGTSEFDDRGNTIAMTDRLGQTTRMEYEPTFNNLTKMTDRLNRVTTYTYDARGNRLSMTNALDQTTTYTYDEFGQLRSTTDPLGHASRMEYDAQGNVMTRVDPLRNTSTMESDGTGRLTAMVDPLGRRTTMTYDALSRVIETSDPAGAVTKYTYDANGNQTGITDALNHVWKMEYDARNRLVRKIDPLNRLTRMEYNTNDELIALTSPSNRTTFYTYSTRGQVATMMDPAGGMLSYTYDRDQNLVALSDERGNTTTFTYDELDRLKSVSDPLGRTTSTIYDAEGNTTTVTDRLGRATRIIYDALNRLSTIQYADATVTYGYDASERPTSINDDHSGSITWTYDDGNRLLSELTSIGGVSYTYNAASDRTSMTAADRPPVKYTYDTAGRLVTISQNLEQGLETFTYSYDTLSRRTSLQRPNGVTTTHSYDELNRPVRLKHQRGTDSALEDFRYTYSDDDEIAVVTSLYSVPQLSTEKTVSSADAANHIPNLAGTSFTFNALGQTTSRTNATGTTNYIWDARGRLISVEGPGRKTNYTYDALGRRMNLTSSGVTTRFLYDGFDIVVDINEAGRNTNYLNYPDIDDQLRQSSEAGGAFYPIQDSIGSVIALTDSSSNISERLQYETFGESSSSRVTRYGFTGREKDPDTGLLYYRARWYDPQQQRFLSEDPIGFDGGLNFYRYVENNPVSRRDPLGLVGCEQELAYAVAVSEQFVVNCFLPTTASFEVTIFTCIVYGEFARRAILAYLDCLARRPPNLRPPSYPRQKRPYSAPQKNPKYVAPGGRRPCPPLGPPQTPPIRQPRGKKPPVIPFIPPTFIPPIIPIGPGLRPIPPTGVPATVIPGPVIIVFDPCAIYGRLFPELCGYQL